MWRDLEPWRLGTLAAISMILGSGSRDLQTHQGKSWPGMHRVWTRVDSVVPVKKLMRYHALSCSILREVNSGLLPCEIFHSSQLGSPINAPCLDWSRFGHTASC